MNETLEKSDGMSGADTLSPPPVAIGRASLFLDFDGTLAEIAPRPDAVVVSLELRGLIEQLSGLLSGRVAVISGRSIDEIAAMLPVPGLAIAGSHGLELQWPDGQRVASTGPDDHEALLQSLSDFSHAHPGTLVERKPFGAGLHYRGAPQSAEPARQLAEQLAGDHGLSVQAGKMVYELRPAGRHKGDAIRAFMAGFPFSEGTPWFLGDDVTDEDGFRMVRDLGGIGVLVGEARPTVARFRLADVAGVHDWLGRVAETVR